MKNKKEIKSTTYETVSYTCDVCGKESLSSIIPVDWAEVFAKTSDGYDYFYSEEYHFCSVSCLFNMLPEIIEIFDNSVNRFESDINGFSIPFWIKILEEFKKIKN
jgi:hypothetical protein